MKKFILLIALSVFLCSATGHTMRDGEEGEGAAPRGKESARARLKIKRRGPAGVNQAEQLPSPAPSPSPLPRYGLAAPDGEPSAEAAELEAAREKELAKWEEKVAAAAVKAAERKQVYGPALPDGWDQEQTSEQKVVDGLAAAAAERKQVYGPALPDGWDQEQTSEQKVVDGLAAPDGDPPAEAPELEAERAAAREKELAKWEEKVAAAAERKQVYGPALPDGWDQEQTSEQKVVDGLAAPDGEPPAEAPAPEGEEEELPYVPVAPTSLRTPAEEAPAAQTSLRTPAEEAPAAQKSLRTQAAEEEAPAAE